MKGQSHGRGMALIWLAAVALLLAAWGKSWAGSEVLSDIATFDFRDAPLSEVLRVFTASTGVNVVSSPKIQDMRVSLFLEKVPPMLALETVCRNNNLWYVRDANVIRVMMVEDYGRELVLGRNEVTRVFNLRYASCLALAQTIAHIFSERVVYNTPEDIASYGHVGTDDYPTIGKELDIEADSTSGSATPASRSGSQKDVEAGGVTIKTEDMARLRELAASKGEVSADELLKYQIGKARAMLTVFPRNNAVVVCSVDRKLLGDIENLVAELDTPTRQVLLEGRVFEVTLGDGFESFFDVTLTPGASKTKDANGNVVRDDWGWTSVDLVDAFDATAAPLSGATVRGIFTTENLQARIEMLEKNSRVHKIATPVMMCANNASAKFFQGTVSPLRTGYTVTDASMSSDGDVITPSTVKTSYREEELGVTLEISPSINMDGTVTLKIVTNISSLNTGGGPDFNYVVSGVAQVGETDTVDKTELEGIVMAKDGQPLTLGGLISEGDVKTISKVPILGDLPLLGFLFSSRSTEKARKEIIFCITPHIIMGPEDQERVNANVLQDISENPATGGGNKRLIEYDSEKDKVRSSAEATPVYRLPRPASPEVQQNEEAPPKVTAPDAGPEEKYLE